MFALWTKLEVIDDKDEGIFFFKDRAGFASCLTASPKNSRLQTVLCINCYIMAFEQHQAVDIVPELSRNT